MARLKVRATSELPAEIQRPGEETEPAAPAPMLGQSPAMRTVFALLERFARSDACVLITGETGVGKELAARVLHERSTRSTFPFVALDCALPENLLETELFGDVRGSLADARSARPGLFLEAHHGTLFLDHVAELPLALQAKLLWVLQDRAVCSPGSDKEVAFDVRIVCATHRDLEARVSQGLFREDLYYLLNILQLELPPLRERDSDILLLANELLSRVAARRRKCVRCFSPEAARKLTSYSWPGNVRELANTIERAVALAEHEEITVADLPEKIRCFSSATPVTGPDPSELVPLEEMERRYILRVLEAVGGNRSRASEILGMDRKTLYNRLKLYDLRTAETDS